MEKILARWASRLRQALRLPDIEHELVQVKSSLDELAQVKLSLDEQELRTAQTLALLANHQQHVKSLLDEQELRTAATFALLANQQQQMTDQIAAIRKLLAQASHAATEDCAFNGNHERQLAALLDELTLEVRKISTLLDRPGTAERKATEQ